MYIESQVLCGSALPDAIAAARPFLPGLLQGLGQPWSIGRGASPLTREPSWLAPVAALLAPAACAAGEAAEGAGSGDKGPGSPSGAEELPSPAAGRRGGRKRGGSRRHSAQKENEDANAAAEHGGMSGDAADGARAKRGAGGEPAAADPPAVKALLQAAALSKVLLFASWIPLKVCCTFHWTLWLGNPSIAFSRDTCVQTSIIP